MLFNGRKDLEGPSRAPRAGIGELARLSKAVQSVLICSSQVIGRLAASKYCCSRS
jgi:hypothetical protein